MNGAQRHARIVIIGGGVIGTSIAYQLARSGERDILLIEKSHITDGCTWHAAGLVGQLRSKRNLTRLMQTSVAVFDQLESDSGMPIDWRKVGSLRLASSKPRWDEIRRMIDQAKSFGVDCSALSAGDAVSMFPHIDDKDLHGAAFIPGDGYIDPYALTQAYAKSARSAGVEIMEGVTVTDVIVKNRRICGVATEHSTIGCDILVNCAGLWAKRIGDMVGISLAAGVVEHQYFLTEKKLQLDPSLPTLRDPDKNFYLKPDTGAFAIGGWETGTRYCWDGRPPFEFGRELFQPNLDRLTRFALPAAERLPVLNEIGIQSVINGPIPVSADGEPIMGPVPEYDNLFVACGFTAGIAASGGAGVAMANWIIDGDPGMDLWAFDARRFAALHGQTRFLAERAKDAYARYYQIHWPGEETQAARGLRKGPLHARLQAAGAVHGAKFGWERPNWFRLAGDSATDTPSFTQKPGWFDAIGRECRAIRHDVALIDQTSFTKFEIAGPGAHAALDRIASNRLPARPGQVVYTQLCNERGGIEADLTIIRLAEERFLAVTGAGFAVRDGHWIKSQLPDDNSVDFRDVTNSLATINLCGPKAREVLCAVSGDDVSNSALPFLAAKTVEIGMTEALAVRIGYVGELGYELYVATDMADHVYEQLWHAGQAAGIINAGYWAVESCRLEKGYLYWSADIGPDVNPYEAGLGFCVALDKGDFIGRSALARMANEKPERKLAVLALEDFAPLYGNEPVLADNLVVGAVSSAGYGHELRHTIAFAMLPASFEPGTRLTIEAFGNSYDATVAPRCLYDAKMTRLRA